MKTGTLSAALVLGLMFSAGVAADALVMRDGRTLAGEFIGSTARSVHLRTAQGIERHALRDVESIRLDLRPPQGERDPSAQRGEPVSRAMIVGQGQDQSIERVPQTN